MNAPVTREDKRRKLLAKVHIAVKSLGLSDEEYRDGLRCNYGAESAADLGIRQLEDLVAHFTRQGWRAKAGPGAGAGKRQEIVDRHGKPRHAAQDRQRLLGKIEALLSEKGRVECATIPWSYASAILEKQCGIKRLEWATPEQLGKVVAALIYDARRNGRRTR